MLGHGTVGVDLGCGAFDVSWSLAVADSAARAVEPAWPVRNLADDRRAGHVAVAQVQGELPDVGLAVFPDQRHLLFDSHGKALKERLVECLGKEPGSLLTIGLVGGLNNKHARRGAWLEDLDLGPFKDGRCDLGQSLQPFRALLATDGGDARHKAATERVETVAVTRQFLGSFAAAHVRPVPLRGVSKRRRRGP